MGLRVKRHPWKLCTMIFISAGEAWRDLKSETLEHILDAPANAIFSRSDCRHDMYVRVVSGTPCRKWRTGNYNLSECSWYEAFKKHTSQLLLKYNETNTIILCFWMLKTRENFNTFCFIFWKNIFEMKFYDFLEKVMSFIKDILEVLSFSECNIDFTERFVLSLSRPTSKKSINA